MQFIKVETPPAAAITEIAPVIDIEPVISPSEITFQTRSEKPAKVVYIEPEPVITEQHINWKERAVTFIEPKLSAIVTIWLIGVFALAIWHLGGYAQLQKLRKKMVKQVDSSLHDKLKILTQKLGVIQTVQLLESALVQVPTVVGWLKPVILLPASTLTGLTTEQLEAILAHELAHIKRYDYLVNILQTIVEILGFYHPAVWWISRKIRNERENCCDDIAVAICGDKIHYAKALASMEEIRGRDQLAVAATGGNLFSRICRLLGKNTSEKNTLSWIPALTVILLLIALAIPTTIAFTSNRNDDPNSSQIEKMLIDSFRENHDKFESGILAWTRTTMNDGFGNFSDGKYETKGSFQLWWDGDKIATRYTKEQYYTGERGSGIEQITGGNIYDGKLLSRKPQFNDYENWLEQVIRWTGEASLDKDIAQTKTLENAKLDWEIVEAQKGKLIKMTFKSLNNVIYSIRYFDISKGCNQIRRESYNDQGQLSSLETRNIKQFGDGWFPVEVDMKSFDTKTSKVTLKNHFVLDLEQCSFNEPETLPKGIFDFSTVKEHEQLNKILEKYSKDTTIYDDNMKSACDSVFNYITSVMSKKDEEAVKFAYPESSISHSDDNEQMREILKGQQVQLIAVYADDWNALVTTSVILADHGRIGPMVFQLKRIFLEQKEHWLIEDIDIETIDSIEEGYERFLKENSDAKTLKLEEPISIPLDIENENNAEIQSENTDSNTKILIEAQVIQANDMFLNQVGLINDPNYMKYPNKLTFNSVDDTSTPFMFTLDSINKEGLLKSIDDSKNTSYSSHIFMMSTSGREVTIKSGTSYKINSQELGRFLKIKPQISQDDANVNLNCELTTRQFKKFDLYNKNIDQNNIPESDIVEYKVNTKNALLSDGQILLIVGGKLVSLYDEEDGEPILSNIPFMGKFSNETSEGIVEDNEIILIKATIVPAELNNNSKFLSDNIFISKSIQVNFDLHLLEPGQYVELKGNGKREVPIEQVTTSSLGKSQEDFPAYAANIDFDIRSNFDLNLASKRYTKSLMPKHDTWDASFTDTNTVIGNGNFTKKTLFISAWRQNIYSAPPNATFDNLVEVQIKPVKSENPSDAQWGQDVNGLRASLEFIPDKKSYSLGERIGIRFKIQNVSNKDIQIAYSELLDSYAEITNSRDEDVSRPSPYTVGSGWPRTTRVNLKPNETITLNNFGLGFGRQDDPALVKEVFEPNDYTTREYNQLEPGQYSIQYKISLPNVYTNSIYEEDNVPQPNDWKGTLNTQAKKINLTERQSLLSNANKGNSDSANEEDMIGPSPNEFIINTSGNTPTAKEKKESEEIPDTNMVQHTYDITDIVYYLADKSNVKVSNYTFGSMGASGGISNQTLVDAAKELVNQIMEAVEPDSWYEKNNKAKGTLYPYPAAQPKKLAVKNTPEIQIKVEEFLETLRESIDYTLVAIETRYIYGNEQAINEILKSIGIRESGAANLEDTQVTKLIKGIQGNQNTKLMALPKVTVLNDETAVFQNMVQQPVPPDQINPFFKITPHISEDKDIVFITFDDKRPLEWNDSNRPPDITGTLETRLTIINDKTCAFSLDGNNQKDSSSDKKSLILIKATIVPPEEDKQEDTGSITTLNPEATPQNVSEQSISFQLNDSKQVLIETQIVQVSKSFLKQLGLDANSLKESDKWSKYSIDESSEPNKFVIDELTATLLQKTIDASIDTKVTSKPALITETGKQANMTFLTETYLIYKASLESKSLTKQDLEKVTFGPSINFTPEIVNQNNVRLNSEFHILENIKPSTVLKINDKIIPTHSTLSVVKTLYGESFETIIPNGYTLLIIGNKISKGFSNESKTPILGDLPLLDRVFSNRSYIVHDEYIQFFLIKPTIVLKYSYTHQPVFHDPIDPNNPLIRKLEKIFKEPPVPLESKP